MRIKSTIPQFVSQNCQIVQLITQFEFHDLYTPSPRWRSRTAWTSRPSAVCSTTTRRASRWIHTPTLPRTRSSKRRKRWAISYPVLSDGFRYPLSLGSASAHPIEMWRSNKLGIKEKISRGNFPRLIFSCPVPSGLPHRSHCVPMNMNRRITGFPLTAAASVSREHTPCVQSVKDTTPALRRLDRNDYGCATAQARQTSTHWPTSPPWRLHWPPFCMVLTPTVLPNSFGVPPDLPVPYLFQARGLPRCGFCALEMP